MTQPEYPTAFLIGERVILRPVEPSDAALLQKWSNDPEIRVLTGETTPSTLADEQARVERMHTSPDRAWFMIIEKETGRAIGETGLLRMFPAWRTTDLSIILGEKDCWNKGFGTEAIHLMMDYAFGALAFHRISIGVVGFNESALRFYHKVGFKQEGIQREGYFYNHQFSDFIMMSILEDEFHESMAK